MEVNYNDLEILHTVLSDKYGESHPLYSGMDMKPKSPAIACSFDKATVFIIIRPNVLSTHSAYIGYTSPGYDKLLKAYRKKAMANDI